ncbi:glycosyltransferase family 4 protein [Xylanimonas ulmi]|nr:glycosyltransferase family 4 protein [Xylanibacterium ulmi]
MVSSYPPAIGGLERHIADLAEELASLGHTVGVFTLAPRSRPMRRENGVEVCRYAEIVRVGDVLGLPTAPALRRLREEVKAWRPDAISVHTRFFPPTWFGVLLARRLGVPSVLTEHGSGHVVSESTLVHVASRVVDGTLGRWALRRASLVLGISRGATAFVDRLAGRRAVLFQNAVRLSAGASGGPHPERIVFLGRMVGGKGWDTFLEVAGELRRRGVAFDAVMLGDGPELEQARAEVARLALADVVDVRGGVSHAEVYEALRSAVLVNPTLLAEGFQTTVMEAVAAGGRVVTYAGSQSGEALVEDGAPVTIVPRGDKAALCEAVLAELAQPSAPFAAERFAQWTWPERAREYEALLAGLTAGQPGRD